VIGIDTNILVRFFAKDEPEQYLRARNLFKSLTSDEPGFIPLVTIVELVWVMEGFYRVTKDETLTLLENLLRTQEMVVENAHVVWEAIRIYARSSADFPDCLIERSAHHGHCTHSVTLDLKAAKTAGMVLLDS
jgi:predicted nucleic-acid-binding protein